MKFIWTGVGLAALLLLWLYHRKPGPAQPPEPPGEPPVATRDFRNEPGEDRSPPVDELTDPESVAASARLARAFELVRSTVSYRLSKREVMPSGDSREIVVYRHTLPGQGLRQRKELREYYPDGTLKRTRVEVFTKDVSFVLVDERAYVVVDPVPPPDYMVFEMKGPITASNDRMTVYRRSITTLANGKQVEVITCDGTLFFEQFPVSHLPLPTVSEWFIDPSTGLLLGTRVVDDSADSYSGVYTKAEFGGADDESLYQLPSGVDVHYLHTPFALPLPMVGGD